ncbi:hypothetical protein SLITK23_42990 [Streptomyces lividans]|nr:hypothetical protein JCM4020_45800 [Streptomyces coelicolor]BDE41054.1 hypothetical protein SLITK23_42990 [Streptomyces lividans]GHC21057.1 hypothetical protein GCM10010348_52590 [Streptomyces anthocyanicus]
MSGAAIETIVWSMNVIATANIMAARASGWEVARRPAPGMLRSRFVGDPLTRPVCARAGAPASARSGRGTRARAPP